MINISLLTDKIPVVLLNKINTIMKNLPANNFFNQIDYRSIVDTIKNIYMSDGAMSTLLDLERVLDDADIYAYKNWKYGELVQGPDVGRYKVSCMFMWPYKLMPDPRASIRLLKVGCDVIFKKTKIKVPIRVTSENDFQIGTQYPKMVEKEVWLVRISVPLELMDDIKEGTIDLADETIDLSDIEDAYDEDLDQITQNRETETNEVLGDMGGDMGMAPPMPM